MNKLFTLSLAALALASCAGTSTNEYKIAGTATGLDGQQVVLLNYETRDTVAVTTIKDGKFEFKGNVDGDFEAMAMIDREHRNYFFVEPGTIKLDMNSMASAGTKLNDEYAAIADFITEIQEQFSKPGANVDSLNTLYLDKLQSSAAAHVGDVLGLVLTRDMASEMNRAEIDSVMALSPRYANDARIKAYAASIEAMEATGAGNPYLDVTGVNATTGEAMKLSDIVAKGKPVIVDFWASWCGPCRREIKEYLSRYAEEYKGKVNFVGIAVWEQSVEDTKKAMGELPISWPVLYADGQGRDITEAYGIQGIPHIMLIAADGTILARDLRGTAIDTAIQDELNP